MIIFTTRTLNLKFDRFFEYNHIKVPKKKVLENSIKIPLPSKIILAPFAHLLGLPLCKISDHLVARLKNTELLNSSTNF